MASERTYRRRIAALRSILEQVEWVQPMYNGSPSCSFCDNQKHFGHTADCTLAKAIDAQVGPIGDADAH